MRDRERVGENTIMENEEKKNEIMRRENETERNQENNFSIWIHGGVTL